MERGVGLALGSAAEGSAAAAVGALTAEPGWRMRTISTASTMSAPAPSAASKPGRAHCRGRRARLLGASSPGRAATASSLGRSATATSQERSAALLLRMFWRALIAIARRLASEQQTVLESSEAGELAV